MSAGVAHPAPVAVKTVRGLFLSARLVGFALTVGLCCVLSAAGLLQGPVAAAFACGAVAVAMWHGAYDHVQAEQMLAPMLGRYWLAVFLSGYIALAGAVLLGWYRFPLASLVLFLAYSAWHFGTEPEEQTPGPTVGFIAFLAGAVPIVAACRWHGGEVAPILEAMLGRRPDALANAQGLVAVLSFVCWPVLLLAAFGVLSGFLGPQCAALSFVLALEGLVFRMCGPLPAFAVFFCCWHAPEHLLATSGRAGSLKVSLRHNLQAGFVPWVFSLLLLGAVLVWGRHTAIAYQGELFIFLSALTVPHMMLNELGRSRWARRSRVKEGFA